MTQLKDFSEDFVLFSEAGFVAINQSDEDSAIKLFHAAQAIEKDHTVPKIGLAMIALHKLELKKAIKILEEVLKVEPDNNRAQILLGICHVLGNKEVEKGESLLKGALDNPVDPASKKLAELWLEVVEKAVKKSDQILQPKAKGAKDKEADKKTANKKDKEKK